MKKIFYNEQGWVCQRFPYDIPVTDENRFIEVNDETFQSTLSNPGYTSWRVVDGKLELQQYGEIPFKELYEQELLEIQNWFLSTDYIPNKIITGEWLTTDPRWLSYMSERTIKRARQDELNLLLKDINTN